ncbi:MAG: RMD1 family protein, partial [Gammaproteobacteria bacterium]
FFWDEIELETIYEMVIKYLDQEKRVMVLNQKLSVIQQLLDMLVNELGLQHSSNLEWIIIILLCIEIAIAFFR